MVLNLVKNPIKRLLCNQKVEEKKRAVQVVFRNNVPSNLMGDDMLLETGHA